jgi:glycosyltransferase involved in cell wall biosynthesis
MALFDIIIATYNNLDELKSCLSGFETQTVKNFRLLICVDGSTDGTLAYLSKTRYPFEFKILTHPDGKRKGRNPARNLSLGHITSKYLVMFDSDICPAPDFLEKHLTLLKNKNCISLGDVIYTDSKVNDLSDYLQHRGKNKYKNGDEIPAHYLITQNVAFESQYFVQIKGQDGSMVTYGGGDTEFAYRLWKTFRLPVIFNASAAGYAELNKDLPTYFRQMEEFGSINLPYIYKKYPEFTKLFRFDRLISGSFQNRFLRLFLQPWMARWAYTSIPYIPRLLRRKMIHYLVFYHIYCGYRDSLK